MFARPAPAASAGVDVSVLFVLHLVFPWCRPGYRGPHGLRGPFPRLTRDPFRVMYYALSSEKVHEVHRSTLFPLGRARAVVFPITSLRCLNLPLNSPLRYGSTRRHPDEL